MNIFNAISVVVQAVETIFNISSFSWDKKSLKTLAITTAVLAGGVAVVTSIDKKEK